ncbi:MAG: UDP-N-acetylmuramate dehydrogenase [Roseburia sp.]
MTEGWIDRMSEAVGLSESQVKRNEPMSRHTTFRIGGPADVVIQPDIQQLEQAIAYCRQEQIPYTIIGNGSNLLVGDGGIRGVVMELAAPASLIRIQEDRIYAQAGALLSKVASMAAEAGLTGMEFAAGIPGSIGGAVYMNAGAYGGEMKQIVESVDILRPDGTRVCIDGADMEFSYRYSVLQKEPGIVCGVTLHLQPGDKDQIYAYMKELRDKRLEKQPLEYPSAGSTFKRPEGYFAGKLIMDAGLRGFRVGDAQVAEKHCGFVINRGAATAKNVIELTDTVRNKVEEQFGVELELEVKRLGEFL